MFAACPLAAHGDEPVSPGESTEAQRFEAEKQRFAAQKESQWHSAILNYVTSAKQSVDSAWKAWHPPANADFGPYMADMQRRIKRAWFPPKGNESKRVVVQFKISNDGHMSDLSIEHSSGLAIADQAALKAVENAAPFGPPPGPIKDPIQFTFDYNVFFGAGGHGVFREF